MNKVISFTIGVFSSLFLVFGSAVFAIPCAEAQDGASSTRKRRYRYKQRHHRVQIGGYVTPWASGRYLKDKHLTFNVDFLYGYNLGWFELGPNVVLKKLDTGTDIKTKLSFEAGLWGDLNLIKNTRRQKIVPAIGLRVNYIKGTGGSNQNFLLAGPKLSLKLFPSSRTGFVLDLGFDYSTPFNKMFKEHGYGLNVKMGYVHYFN